MEVIYLKSLLSLALVIALLYSVLKLIQKYTKFGASNSFTEKKGSISINSIAYIDVGSKVINFECNNKNYIVLLGKHNNLLIDKYENTSN